MAKSEVDEVTKKAVENGGYLVKLYFDMQSDNEADLQPLMTDLVSNKLLKEPGVIYCSGAIDETIKIKEIYSTSAVVSALFRDLGALINVVFNYAPAGVEIIKPEREVQIKTAELQSILLSLSQVSADYSQYILSRVLTSEDYAKIQSDLKNREQLGKRLMNKKGDDEEKENGEK